jgi:hypothetical protein
MHNLHFLLVRAESARAAADKAESLTDHWGDENNWRSIGGVASEDGSDDVENHGGGRWSLSFLDAEEDIPKHDTYFSRAVAFLHRSIMPPLTFPCAPYSTHPSVESALMDLSSQLLAFEPASADTLDLWRIGRNLKHLSQLIESQRAIAGGEAIPEFYDWKLGHFGLTDLTEESDAARRYLLFLDMHS